MKRPGWQAFQIVTILSGDSGSGHGAGVGPGLVCGC